jgi:inhibitor of KinA
MTFNLTYKPYGERSILVEWSEKIDLKILQDIISFKNKVTESNLKGIVNITNAYNSILVTYTNSNIDFKDQKSILKKVYTSKKMKDNLQFVLWKIPVCYNTIFASDLETISQTKKLSKEAIIKLHSQAIYTIYFIGFLPGFLYLGGLDDKLHFPRKDAPQLKIKKGAVAIGANQTGVYPEDSPGGWNIIGNTPLSFFDASKINPCFASPGDKVQFYPISLKEYKNIKVLVDANVYQIESEVIND